MKTFSMLAAAVLSLAVIALAGCGGRGDSASSGPSDAAGASSGGRTAVTIEDFAYSPAGLSVAKGTTVEFTNRDSTNHTATSKSTGIFDTGTIGQGHSKPVTLTKPGSFAYICSFHPFMHGTITVTG